MADGETDLSFSDLPNKKLGKIVNKLDVVDRQKAPNMSRSLRVDNQKTVYDEISVHARAHCIKINFDTNFTNYKWNANGCVMEYGQSGEVFLKDADFLETALNDLAIVMKNPKLELEQLSLTFDKESERVNDRVVKFFKSLNFQIIVKSVAIDDDRATDILSILSMLKPGTLEIIDLGYTKIGNEAKKLVRMNQWKYAKRVWLSRPIPVGIKEFLHFNRFDIHVESISPRDVILLRNVLSYSTTFKNCHIALSSDTLSISEVGKALGALVPHAAEPFFVHRHPIPGSYEFLEFDIDNEEIYIERKR